MKHIKLSDTFRVSDSKIRGYVVLKKEDGSIVFKKENMIVEKGRKYIKELVFSKISGSTVNDYISELKFGVGSFSDGTSAALTTPNMINLQNNIPDYDKDLITGTKWINLTNNKIYTYVNNEWDNGVTATAVGLIANRATAIPSPVSGNTYFATDESKLYTYTTVWDGGVVISTTLNHINSLSDPELGLRIDCRIVAGEGSAQMINELGLFLAPSGDMFSRLIFEPVPFTNTTTYTLTYYIYF
jgi:hypothetical protein